MKKVYITTSEISQSRIFTIGVKDKMPSLSFFCEETGKEYTFKKPLTGKDLILEIVPPSKVFYSVKMSYK